MTSMHDLHDMAYIMGINLQHHHGLPEGCYSPSLRTISTMHDMAVWDYITTLAHELEHAVYNDQKAGRDDFDQRQEDQADRFAARLLISDEELKHLPLWHRHDLQGLAIDLEVTPRLLKIYLHQHLHILKGIAA